MIHYTCDRCKREIDTAGQTRYVVEVEVRAVLEDGYCEFEDEVDHLAELNEELESTDVALVDDSVIACHRGRYDLCPACHAQYIRNPLGREMNLAIGFSKN